MITKPSTTTTTKGNKLSVELALTKRQIEKLYKLSTKFNEVEWFTLKESHSNGIGSAVVVHFKVFKEKEQDTDTIVDITDYKAW